MKIEKPIKKSKYLWIAAAIIYIISPIDLLPDVFPVIGQIDDIAVILALIIQIFRMLGIDQKINLPKANKLKSDKPELKKDDYVDAEIIED